MTVLRIRQWSGRLADTISIFLFYGEGLQKFTRRLISAFAKYLQHIESGLTRVGYEMCQKMCNEIPLEIVRVFHHAANNASTRLP